MARRGAGGGDGSALKRALLVSGGLALAWLAVETAFKPLLDRLRGAISRSDPAHDPDDDDDLRGDEKGDTRGRNKALNEEQQDGGAPPSN
ncbi:unnamed protein product [Musa acuminata var. zebrina]